MMKRIWLALALAIGLAGCTEEPGADVSQNLTGGWAVTALNGAPVAQGVTVTMGFADGKVSGASGCNRYYTTYTRDDAALVFGPTAMNRMACPPTEMETEAAFGAALDAITRFSIKDGTLMLFAGDQLVMQAAP
jgi:heat shock protein HslJ